MKNKIIYMVGALLSSAILTFSCTEDIPSYGEIAVDKTDVFMKIENPTAEINIMDGNGNYRITVANEKIATAVVNGTKITFTGLKNGTTTATIMDWAKRSTVVKVRVKEDFKLELDKSQVEMFIGEETSKQEISIVSGNDGYAVESDNKEVATAKMNNDGKVEITAVNKGTCNITVTDADGIKTPVAVKVYREHLVLDNPVRIWLANEEGTIDIKSTNSDSNEETKVVSDNETAATATINSEGNISIKAGTAGTANITITDGMGLTTTFPVKVNTQFMIKETQIDTVFIPSINSETKEDIYRRDREIIIDEGSGNYDINSGSNIKCTLSTDKTKLIVCGVTEKMSRNQTIKVTDKHFGNTIEIKVDWVDYDFYNDFGIARYYIQGKFVKVAASALQDDSANKKYRIRVGDGTTYNGTVKSGYQITFLKAEGYKPGVKTNPGLYLIDKNGRDGANVEIESLEIVRRLLNPGESDKGKYWVRFKEKNRTEWSYMIAHT